ncbi:MAG: hypothetical protein AAGG01_08630 [Planctomycetota bacterium]
MRTPPIQWTAGVALLIALASFSIRAHPHLAVPRVDCGVPSVQPAAAVKQERPLSAADSATEFTTDPGRGRRVEEPRLGESSPAASRRAVLVMASDEAVFGTLDPSRHTAGRAVEVTGDARFDELFPAELAPDERLLEWEGRSFRRVDRGVEIALGVEDRTVWIEAGLHAVWCRKSCAAASDFLGEIRVIEPTGVQAEGGAGDSDAQAVAVTLAAETSSVQAGAALAPCLLVKAGPRHAPRLAVDCSGHAAAMVYPGEASGASVVDLEPAGGLALTVEAYRPAPPLTLELSRSAAGEPDRVRGPLFSSRLPGLLSDSSAVVRFDRVPAGPLRVRVLDGDGFVVHESTVTVQEGALATANICLVATEADAHQYGYVQLTILLPTSRELLAAQLGVPLMVRLEPVDVRLAQVGAFRPASIPLASFTLSDLPVNGYVKELGRRIPFGAYRVRLLGLGLIGEFAVEQQGRNEARVECTALLEWHVRIVGPVAVEMEDWIWTASVKTSTESSAASLPARLVRSGEDSFHLYAPPGAAKLVGHRRRGGIGTVHKAFTLRPGESSIDVEVAAPTGCVLKPCRDGEPASFEMDRWPEITVLDDDGECRLLGIRPLDHCREMGTVQALALSSTIAGRARLLIRTRNPVREILRTVTFGPSFPEFRVDL